MAQTDWVFSIESKIYTIVKTRLETDLLSIYPNLHITEMQRLNDKASLPTVYVKMLDSPETGADLEGSTINAVYVTFEVRITVAKSGANMGMPGLRKIAAAVLANFKKLRFQTDTRGEISRESTDTYTFIARFSRVIGAEEEINF